jgi:hypothetical protein
MTPVAQGTLGLTLGSWIPPCLCSEGPSAPSSPVTRQNVFALCPRSTFALCSATALRSLPCSVTTAPHSLAEGSPLRVLRVLCLGWEDIFSSKILCTLALAAKGRLDLRE